MTDAFAPSLRRFDKQRRKCLSLLDALDSTAHTREVCCKRPAALGAVASLPGLASLVQAQAGFDLDELVAGLNETVASVECEARAVAQAASTTAATLAQQLVKGGAGGEADGAVTEEALHRASAAIACGKTAAAAAEALHRTVDDIRLGRPCRTDTLRLALREDTSLAMWL